MREIHVKLTVITPRVPNYLRVAGRAAPVPVGDITDEGLRELGREWTEELIDRAREQRRIQRGSAVSGDNNATPPQSGVSS